VKSETLILSRLTFHESWTELQNVQECDATKAKWLFTSLAHKKIPQKWYWLRHPNNLKLHS